MPIASKAALVADLKSRMAAGLSREAVPGPVLTLGTDEIDSVLPGGGLRLGALHEVVAGDYRDMGAATGFLTALAARAASLSAAPVLWCEASHAPFDTGRLYGPGLAAFGLDPVRLILVSPPRDTDCLWAMEEGLRSGALSAVVGEIDGRSASLDLTATRRLQLAAEESGTPVLLFTGHAGGASVAVSRWRIEAAPSSAVSYAEDCEALPGRPRWHASLARLRGGNPQAWVVEWHEAGQYFSAVPGANAREMEAGPLPSVAADGVVVTSLRRSA